MKNITFRAVTQYLYLHTFISSVLNPTFHFACSQDLFPVCNTNTKDCVPGNSPVQLSSQQHWFHAVVLAHLFIQLSIGYEAKHSVLQPNKANLRMNFEAAFLNFKTS